MTRNRLVGSFVAVALVVSAIASCSKEPGVIPKRQMEKIYHDMFLVDQWVMESEDRRRQADTSWLYEPIFEKYGYTVEDYRTSVNFYLSDTTAKGAWINPEAVVNAATIGGAVAAMYWLYRDIRQQEKIRHRADSIAKAMKAYSSDDFINYGDLFYVNSMTDRIKIDKNQKGVYYPVPVVEDTVFHGPELIIKDSSSVVEPSSVKKPKPIPWRE